MACFDAELNQRDMSISHERLATVAEAAGDDDAARVWHQRGIDIHRRLVANEPDRAELIRQLCVKLSAYAPLSDNESTLLEEVIDRLSPLAQSSRLDAHGANVLEHTRQRLDALGEDRPDH